MTRTLFSAITRSVRSYLYEFSKSRILLRYRDSLKLCFENSSSAIFLHLRRNSASIETIQLLTSESHHAWLSLLWRSFSIFIPKKHIEPINNANNIASAMISTLSISRLYLIVMVMQLNDLVFMLDNQFKTIDLCFEGFNGFLEVKIFGLQIELL